MQSRSNARLAAVQALYQMETGGTGVEAVVAEFKAHRFGQDLVGEAFHDADEEYFADLVRGVVKLQSRIDPRVERRLSNKWTLPRLDATARAILRAAVFEFINEPSLPAAAIINEYVEIANAFFEGDDPRFINAVLDALARDLRAEEFADGRQSRWS
jgi:N utilization substance protein B